MLHRRDNRFACDQNRFHRRDACKLSRFSEDGDHSKGKAQSKEWNLFQKHIPIDASPAPEIEDQQYQRKRKDRDFAEETDGKQHETSVEPAFASSSTPLEICEHGTECEECRKQILPRARPGDGFDIDRMDSKECAKCQSYDLQFMTRLGGGRSRSRICNLRLIAQEEQPEEKQRYQQCIHRMPQNILQMIDRRVDPADQEIELVGKQCQRNVELRIVRRKNCSECCEIHCANHRTVIDQKPVIKGYEGGSDGATVDQKDKREEDSHSKQSLTFGDSVKHESIMY